MGVDTCDSLRQFKAIRLHLLDFLEIPFGSFNSKPKIVILT
jgi:hypothetical protein